MKEITLGAYRMTVDLHRTQTWYQKKTAEWCDCAGCRNMAQVFRSLPPAVESFFASFGVDPMRPAETAHYAGKRLASGSSDVLSSAFYHICGELLEGSRASGIKLFEDEYGDQWQIREGWLAMFKKECDLLADDFPRPCFQMEVFCTIPWVLDDPNPYVH